MGDGNVTGPRQGDAHSGVSLAALVRRLAPQPLIGIATGAAAIATLAAAGRADTPHFDPWVLALMAGLGAALAASYSYPIHIQRGTKIGMGSIALYLSAVLLGPLPAAIAAGAGAVAGGLLVRAERGSYLSDIATDAGRWIVLVTGASLLAHAGWGSSWPAALGVPAALAGAALVLWAGDFLTVPLVIWPMTGQSPWRITMVTVWESGALEGCQYLVGMLGALAVMQQRWAIILLLVPVMPLYRAARIVRETSDSTQHVLETMADAVDLRDPNTGGHSQRVAAYVAQILSAMDLFGPEVDLIVSAARVHDIGKIGTPDAVLMKEGPLTPEERRQMEEHPALGASLLARYPDFARGTSIVRHHHERWEGGGYPDGIRGQAIPFGARVIAAADSFDAMTSDRPYRRGMPAARALAILQEGRGSQWDPEVIDAFLTVLKPSAQQAATPSPAFLAPLPLEIPV